MIEESSRCEALRERIVLFLLFFSSERTHRALAGAVSQEKLAFELCRIWFDELYTPGISYIDSLKGDWSQKETERFEACFDVEELDSLERFHRFFELRLEMLPDNQKRAAIFSDSDMWRNLRRHAGYLVADLEPAADALRKALEARVQLLAESAGDDAGAISGLFHAASGGK